MPDLVPSLEKIAGFIVCGLSVRTKNSDEMTAKTAKLPQLWQQFTASGLDKNLPVFGIYSEYEDGASSHYTATVGIAADKPTFAPAVTIEAGNYLVFHGSGTMPMAAIATWERIWSYFAENTLYQRSYRSDFEKYTSTNAVAIYIGVK